MKTKTAHTPGPWEYRKQSVSPTGTRNLCGVGPVHDGAVWFVAENVSEEDARLIAAAPDLLAACESAYRVSLAPGAPKDHGHAEHVPACFMCQIRAAIAKAEGREVA